MVEGFQWLDGSFIENIEILEDRAPNGAKQREFFGDHSHLFIPAETKKRFFVDAYSFVLGQPVTPFDIKSIAYWYSMWSHRRDDSWKGFLQIDLAPKEDIEARKLLKEIERELTNEI